METPRGLPQQSDILLNPQGELHLLVMKNHLTLAAWPVSEISLGQVVFRKMLAQCCARKINPFQASIYITEYLTHLFQEGREYSTINTNCSMTLPPVDGSMIGKHPIICHFMQGIFNSHPPKSRHSFVWDVNTDTCLPMRSYL